MIIIGIDPGTAILGYGIVEYQGNKFRTLAYGTITNKTSVPMPEKLHEIYNKVTGLISEFNPEVLAMEKLFFNNNVTTAMTVSQARGVVTLASCQTGVDFYEYTPLQVKQAVVGYGKAEKKQVQHMVKVILNLEKIPQPDDAADALAVAICHAHSGNINKMIGRG
jgi:crossover junction endodeoxyribonuclease RuvC